MAAEPLVITHPDDSLEVQCHYSSPTVSQSNLPLFDSNGKNFSMNSIEMDGLRQAGYPGEPLLPIHNVVVALPQNHRVVDIEVTTPDARKLRNRSVIAPAQPETPLSMNGPRQPILPDIEIYQKDVCYPGKLVDSIKTQYCRGYRLVSFNLRPVQYNPGTGEVFWYEVLNAHILTEPITNRSSQLVRCRGLESDRRWVKRIVRNPDMIDNYRVEQPIIGTALSNSRDNYPYVIITSTEFESHFQAFLNHKQTQGYPGSIVTVDWITSNYTGQDAAEMVRNFVIDAYNNWNLEYLLLGGDDDKEDIGGESGDFIVPSRDFFSDTDYEESEDEIPSDMYFACLDGTFNHDNDALWAEPTDGPDGGEVDWFGEVHVGRACVDSIDEVLGFVAPIMRYENANPNEIWLKQAYMVGELLWNDPTYGGDYKDEIQFGSSNHGYTTVGFPESWTVNTLYDRDISGFWQRTELETILNSDNLHIVNHLGHSDVDYCMRLENQDVDNNLTNTIPWLGYSQGCYNGAFDDRGVYEMHDTDCICEHMTTQTTGPFAFIGNSRYGWGYHGSTNGSSQYYDRQFFDALFGEEIHEVGAANQDSKEDNIGFLDYGANRWCGYELNLFGCPQTRVGGEVSGTGLVILDRAFYGETTPMNIVVRDLDLNQDPGVIETTSVTITSGTDTETIVLTETDADSAVFGGTITVSAGSATAGNSIVDAVHDGLITCTYIDADDGMGGSNIPVITIATADFQGPQTSSVVIGELTETTAEITFSTHEAAVCKVYYGETTPPTEYFETVMATEHTLTLTDLEPCTLYHVMIEATDAAENVSNDDNGGAYYCFITRDLIVLLGAMMDSDPGWAYEGQWEWGHPLGNDGDPDAGYNGEYVVGYNLSGAYTGGIEETFCTTTAFDCSTAAQVYLTYWRWLGVEHGNYDHAALQISVNGGLTWSDLWSNPDETDIQDTAWQYQEYDITTIAAGNSNVLLRWVMGETDGSLNFCGWNIDDVMVYYTDECHLPTPTPAAECNNDGDVSLDDTITAGDAQICFQIALGSYTPSVEEACAADCNGDESVTAGDAQQVFMTALGTESCADPI